MESKYSKEELIQAGINLTQILLKMTMNETDGNSVLRHYLKELTSDTGIYKQQKDAIKNMQDTSDRFESEAKEVEARNKENSNQLENVCANFEALNQSVERITSRRDILSEKVQNLHKSINDINGFIERIQKVAKQTNLLSFNASIEAARAGVAGKGFRIIAGEVKKLSNDTTAMSENIAQQISELNINIQNIIDENKATFDFMTELKRMANESSKTLNIVKDDNAKIASFTEKIVSEVALNKESIYASAQDVENQNIQQIQQIADQAAENSISINDRLSFLFEMQSLFNYMKENLNNA